MLIELFILILLVALVILALKTPYKGKK